MLALGFAQRGSAALKAAPGVAQRGFDAVAAAYKEGWVEYRNQLRPIPAAALPVARGVRDLAAGPQGARGQGQPGRVRRLAEHAVGLGRAADRPGQPALGALPPRLGARPLPGRDRAAGGGRHGRRQPRARLPLRPAAARGRLVPAEHPGRRHPKWTSLQMDQVGLPIVLAWQLDRARPKDWRHVREAADLIVEKGPVSEQERWENQEGYSPATIAAEIAGLVCAADIARRNGDAQARRTYLRKADGWAAQRRALDGDHQRPVLAEAVLPARHEGPQARPGHDVRDRRLRALEGRPAARRRRQLPRARPARRQARRRPGGPQHAQGRRQRLKAGGVLAPLQLRRLRRAPRREVVAAVR